MTADQAPYQVRFDWGMAGVRRVDPDVDVLIVVDVLSFTTAVEVALTHGLEVMPFGSGEVADDAAAAAYAATHTAVLVGDPASGLTGSPTAIAEYSEAGAAGASPVSPSPTRLLIPESSGSDLCFGLVEHPATVVAASLRNRTAVAEWVLARQAEKGDRFRVAVIAAGDERADGIRFAAEDLLGAGAVIDALAVVGIDYCSPEAAVATAAFGALRRATGHLISASVSGQEVLAMGLRSDIDLASEIDVSRTVPVLRGNAFRP